MKKILLSLITAAVLLSCQSSRDTSHKYTAITPGVEWLDTNNEKINAHGGGILYHEGIYYWYGECKSDSTYWNPNVPGWECYRTEAGGVNCYSSKDLLNWKYEGLVLQPEISDTQSDLHPSKVLERPKVIYNDKTKKFVMWLHVDSDDYNKAAAGVAVSDSPTGVFTYLGSMHPNGQISRDMTLFKDDDGKAYHIYSSEENLTLQIAELTDDYQGHSGKYVRLFPGGHNEAPAIFKKDGTYWMITSGCTGWAPNAARLFSAPFIWGPWTQHPNPCRGEGSDKTFGGQSTYVLQLPGNRYLFMADIWRPKSLMYSEYLWIPVRFDEEGMPYLTLSGKCNPSDGR